MIIEYRGKRPRIASSAFIAPTAVIIGDVEIGEEASVWFGTVIRGDNGPIRIGARTSVQDNAVLHVSENCATILEDDVTVGHAAVLEDCVVERGSLIGSNACVLNHARIGHRTLVAAGAVVPQNMQVPSEVLVAGIPAQVKRKIDESLSHWMDDPAPEYVHLSRSYLHHGIGDPEMQELITVNGALSFETEADEVVR